MNHHLSLLWSRSNSLPNNDCQSGQIIAAVKRLSKLFGSSYTDYGCYGAWFRISSRRRRQWRWETTEYKILCLYHRTIVRRREIACAQSNICECTPSHTHRCTYTHTHVHTQGCVPHFRKEKIILQHPRRRNLIRTHSRRLHSTDQNSSTSRTRSTRPIRSPPAGRWTSRHSQPLEVWRRRARTCAPPDS